jgi:hypothetical protein
MQQTEFFLHSTNVMILEDGKKSISPYGIIVWRCASSCWWGDMMSELQPPTVILFIYQILSKERDSVMILFGENWRTQRKICLSATLSTTNPTWTDPGFCSEKLVTSCQSYGTAIHFLKCGTEQTASSSHNKHRSPYRQYHCLKVCLV